MFARVPNPLAASASAILYFRMPAVPAIALLDEATASGRVAVKVCGIRDRESLVAVAAAGVDAVGMNFWPRSKRFVPPAEAAGWVAAAPPQVLRVGIFVDPGDDEVLAAWGAGTIHAAQLHGNEPPAQCARLMAAGVPVIKAVGLRVQDDLARAAASGTPYVLVDAFAPGIFGGTGRTVDWATVRAAWDRVPAVRLVLSGGLNPANVAAAVRAVRPAMVDAASGVESAPGVKDLAKVREFVSAAAAG